MHWQDAAVATWLSNVYSHYDVSLVRCLDEATQTPLSMSFKFTCKTHPENHIGPQFHQHTWTGQGTSNLQKDVDQCLKKQGLDSRPKSESAIPYSEANHCALIALRCAKSAHPINMVMDEDYLAEVEMLHPGTVAPSPNTVQPDLIHIYSMVSIFVMNYFMVHFYIILWFHAANQILDFEWHHSCCSWWMDCSTSFFLSGTCCSV